MLWERLVEPCPDDDLAATLVERFDISDERAATDVAAFVGDIAPATCWRSEPGRQR